MAWRAGCAKKLDADLWMTREEYLLARILATDTPPPPDVALRYYHAAGLTPEQLENYAKRFGQFGEVVATLPESYGRLRRR